MSIDVRAAVSEIFRETFEGVRPDADGTWFVQGKEAIFDAIRTTSPENASKKVHGQPATIGAHVWHLNYYLTLFNANLRNEEPESDWEGSWMYQEFDSEQWRTLATDVDDQYREAKAWYDSDMEPADQEEEIYAIANLAHAAYHLGAIRALIPIVTRS
jgi:hypothetical protein